MSPPKFTQSPAPSRAPSPEPSVHLAVSEDAYDPDAIEVTDESPLGAYVDPETPACAWDNEIPVNQFGYTIPHEQELLRMLYAYMRDPSYRSWFTAKYGPIVNPFILNSIACFQTRYRDPYGEKAVNLVYGKVQSRKTDQIVAMLFWAYRAGPFVPVGLLHDSGKEAQLNKWKKCFDSILQTVQELSRLRFQEQSEEQISALESKFTTKIVTRKAVGGRSSKQGFPDTSICGGFVVTDLFLKHAVDDIKEFVINKFPRRPTFTIHDETDEAEATYTADHTEREKLLSFFSERGHVTNVSATLYATQNSHADPLLYKSVMIPPANYKPLDTVNFVDVTLGEGKTLKGKFGPPIGVLFNHIQNETDDFHKNVLINCTVDTNNLNELVSVCAELALPITPFVAFSFHSARIVIKFPRVADGDTHARAAFDKHLAEEEESRDSPFWTFTTTTVSTFQIAYDGAIRLFRLLWPGCPEVTICVAGKMAGRSNTPKPTDNRYLMLMQPSCYTHVLLDTAHQEPAYDKCAPSGFSYRWL